MIDLEIRKLAALAPDRNLERLEEHVWARVAASQRARKHYSRLLMLQAALAAIAFGASAMAGYHSAHWGPTPELSVFSIRSPLNASVRLTGAYP